MHAVSTIRRDISGGVGWDGDAIASNAIGGQIYDLTTAHGHFGGLRFDFRCAHASGVAGLQHLSASVVRRGRV